MTKNLHSVTDGGETSKGSYTLVISLSKTKTIEVGALGDIEFDSGFYAYTGSAFGPGGFKRIDRHRDVSEGKNTTRRWHIDYLSGDEDSEIEKVVKSRNNEVECEVASYLEDEGLKGFESFGCSDCNCNSHLHYSETFDEISTIVEKAHRSLR